MNFKTFKKGIVLGVAVLAICALSVPAAFAQCAAGSVPAFPGSDTCILDPLSIPKYVTPLVIPPVMRQAGAGGSGANYDIAVRQFYQQILPGGIWAGLPDCAGQNCTFPETKVWSYGPEGDPTPGIAPELTSQFNYPAYTIETTSQPVGGGTDVTVRWINELVQNPDACFNDAGEASGVVGDCDYISHILPIDQTLHWANPPQDCLVGPARTDCAGQNPASYMGPVPIVTHVHGAHVEPHSDGYPEAWWLPDATGIPGGYAMSGTLFDDATGANPGTLGYADYSYLNDQPATTLWYHDHSLGMTRNNVYAGPAGFWLIRGGANDLASPPLPGPAPTNETVLELNVPGDPKRNAIREIPIVIQDRTFDPNGQLFYPDNRAFFEGLNPEGGTAPTLQIPFVPTSDIAPIWNPEAFFTTMVVNGVTWPKLEVAPALYRFRLLNGCNSRFLNLALFEVTTPNRNNPARERFGQELPFYQIGAEQGFLRQVVQIQTGFATPLAGMPLTRPSQMVAAPNNQQALLMGLAERADVIVDFRGLPDGTRIRMINTAPDAPFGGFPDVPADPATTGQVMEFVVRDALNGASATDPLGGTPATDPWLLALPSEIGLSGSGSFRNVSLNEEESLVLCVTVAPDGSIVAVPGAVPPLCLDPAPRNPRNPRPVGVPFAPKAALLGTVAFDPVLGPIGIPLKWTDAGTPKQVVGADGTTVLTTVNVTENPQFNATEDWNMYNFTVDGHPIHLHLVRFNVVARTLIGAPVVPGVGVQPWETGYKDTVIALPGEITTVRAKFDIGGLYVWHCHIVEHEDNEMMRPYFVGN